MRQPRRLAEKKNRQRGQRRAFADTDGDAAGSIDGLQKQHLFRAVQQPADNAQTKIRDEKNHDKSRAFEHQRRETPQGACIGRRDAGERHGQDNA